ncbi:MAG: hypothetical protein E7378_01145 [Clostridiales bacterium]|nr:hypothetical protein [Clostridiales bacterium]
MKRKLVFIFNIVSFCLCVCAIAIGVWSVKRASLFLNGDIGFVGNNCNATITIEVDGAATTEGGEAQNDLYVQNDGTGLGSATKSEILLNGQDLLINLNSLFFPNLSNGSTPPEIVMTFTITNTSNFPIVAYLELDDQLLLQENNIIASWDQIGGTMLEEELITIQLTLKCNSTQSFATPEVFNNNTFKLVLEQAVVGKQSDGYWYEVIDSVEQKFCEYDGNLVLTPCYPNGAYINYVPNGTGEITIPAVLQKVNGSYVKIDGICYNYFENTNIFWDEEGNIIDESEYTGSEHVWGGDQIYGTIGLNGYSTIKFANGIKTIGAYSLCTMEMYHDNNIHSIDEGGTRHMDYAVTTIELPKTLTHIGEFAFASCQNLSKKLVLPQSFTAIKEIEFLDADDTSYNACSFSNYYNTNSYAIWADDTGFTGFTEIILPSSLKTFDGFYISHHYLIYANISDTIITSLTITSGTTSISENALKGCTKLATIKFLGTMEQWNAIQKGANWNYQVPATQVVCNDGNVAL